MSSILTVGRSILACLQPMTGERATGTVLFTMVNPMAGVSVPAHTYMSPVVNGAYRADLAFKVPKNMSPKVVDGGWPLNASGSTAIPVMSNLGGSRYNLPANTRFRLEPDAGDNFVGEVVSNVDFTGGTDRPKSTQVGEADLALWNAVLYETFGTADSAEAFNSGMGGRFPAVLLTWLDDEPADGMATSNLSTQSKRGSLAMQYAQDFELWLVCDRSDNEALRRGQMTRLLDEISYNLYDRMSADELIFSSPGGLKIKRRAREVGNEQFFKQFRVYTMLLSATITQEKKVLRNPAPLVRFQANYSRQDDVLDDLPMLNNERYLASPGTVAFALPANNSSHARGTTVVIQGTMPYAEAELVLNLDGARVLPVSVTGTVWSYSWAIPGGFALGAHTFQVVAINENSTQTTASLSLTVTP